METNNRRLAIISIFIVAFFSCKQAHYSKPLLGTLKTQDSIVYIVDSSVNSFINDTIFKGKNSSEIQYCLIRYCNNDNITEVLFYYQPDSIRKENEVYVRNTNRFLKINKSIYLPIIFETDWAFGQQKAYTNQNYYKHLKQPFHLWYAVLQFRSGKIIKYKNFRNML